MTGSASGVVVVDDGANLVLTDGTGGGAPVVTGGDWVDVSVKQAFRSLDGNVSHAGLIARYVDINNMVYGGIVSPTEAEIWVRNGGSWSNIGANYDANAAWNIPHVGISWHTQELRISDDIVELYIDEALIGYATLPPGSPTHGATGFWSQYSGKQGYRDNHVVESFDLIPDPFGHGTHVAGLIAGNGNASNSQQRGIATSADIVSLRVLDDQGRGNTSDVIAALDWILANGASHGIEVVNLSLGKAVEESVVDDPLVQAAEAAWDAGFVVVASAGNYGRDGNFTITSPGNSPKLITVGSLTDEETTDLSDDYVSSYSSRGPTLFDHFVKPDLLAPGNRVVFPIAANAKLMQDNPTRVVLDNYGDETYLELSGTSMAAALTSGAVALSYSRPSRGCSRSSTSTKPLPRRISAQHSSRPRRRSSASPSRKRPASSMTKARSRSGRLRTWPTASASTPRPTSSSSPRPAWTRPTTSPSRPSASSSSTATSPRAPEAPRAGVPTNDYGPSSPPAHCKGARLSRLSSKLCRPTSRIRLPLLYSRSRLDKPPMLGACSQALAYQCLPSSVLLRSAVNGYRACNGHCPK